MHQKNTEEIWDTFIRKIQNTNISQDEDFQKYPEEKIKSFDKFKQNIKEKINNKKIFKNPFLRYKSFGKNFMMDVDLMIFLKKNMNHY